MIAITWDTGTAYDLFISLHVLHFPDQFGLRPTWAAGVRSRIPQPYRDFLEETIEYMHIPFGWLSQLPQSEKNCKQVIDAMENMDTQCFLLEFTLKTEVPKNIEVIFNKIVDHRKTSGSELVTVRAYLRNLYENNRHDMLNSVVHAWENGDWYKQNVCASFRAYNEVFFSLETERIQEALENFARSTKEMVTSGSPEQVIEYITRGVNFSPYMQDTNHELSKIILAPSYWASPLTFFEWLNKEKLIIVFGCRKDDDSIIPGEYIPNSIVTNLKTLADPTRLRILKSLMSHPSAPSELASQLRLRTPTVIHHLQQLRIAGMVRIHLLPDGKKTYQIRPEIICQLLSDIEELFEIERETAKQEHLFL
jgi:DNA-binding transcriptional ArsR family regulator